MRRETQSLVLLVLGALVVNLALRAGLQSYVKAGLKIPLLISAAFLLLIGGVTLLGREDADHDGHGHGPGALRVGVLLLAPVVAIMLVAPVPLGAFAASRGAENQAALTSRAEQLGPLPGVVVDGVVTATMTDFLVRFYGAPDLVQDVPVRLTGFVVVDPDVVDGFRLTRFTFNCCAADALPLQVIVTDAGSIPPEDEWIEIEAIWRGDVVESSSAGTIPVLEVQSLRSVPTPEYPYEY